LRQINCFCFVGYGERRIFAELQTEKTRTMNKYLMVGLKGCAMGMADVVPGVSGGTIAFISGIYEELLGSIKSIDLEAIKLLFTGKFRTLWKKINGNFLFSLIAGIGVAILTMARVMTYMLENHPIITWSFFFGLIIASALMVAREVKHWSAMPIVTMVIGAALSYWITVVSPATTPNDWWFVMLSGAIAICAMILPGISGAFILLLMGKYMFIMEAVTQMNIGVLALFAVGAIVGIVSFSHVLSWLLARWHDATVTMLMGFMIGSLNKVWPWKQTLETYLDSHGVEQPLVQANVSPVQFETLGSESHLVLAIVSCVIGFALIYIIELIGERAHAKKEA
jgi:putative membrane protein